MGGIGSQVRRIFWHAHSRGWDEIRAQPDNRAHLVEVVHQLAAHLPAGGAVIDLGCGPGHQAVALAEAGFEVTAVDYATGMLRLARAKADERALPVTFVQVDLERDLPVPDESFDGAHCAAVFYLIADPVGLLERIHRCLKPGGHLLVETLPPGSPVRRDAGYLRPADRALQWLKYIAAHTPGAVRRHQPDELARLLEASGFSVIETRPSEVTYTILSRR